MDELKIAPGPGIPDGLVLPASDFTERFSRASGPGGQGVNTTDSRVQLSLDLAACSGLTDAQRQRALRNLESRLSGTVLTVNAATERSQLRNRALARQRLAQILRTALAPAPPPRRKTRPTKGSIRRRLESKRQRSELKASRKRPAME